MVWAKAHIEIKPASVGTGIKAILRQTKRQKANLTFTISEAVAKKLGWQAKDGIEILIGEGEHHGLIRMRKNRSAAQVEMERRETGKGSWFSIKLGHQPAFVDRTEAPAWCQWEQVEDGWIEIVLPKWADETAPNRKPQAVTPRPAISAPSPQRRGVDVTAAIMGDPEPGRREMVEKIGRKEALERVGRVKV